MLAALQFNENVNNEEAVITDGTVTPKWKVSYPKYKKGKHVLTKVTPKVTHGYQYARENESEQSCDGCISVGNPRDHLNEFQCTTCLQILRYIIPQHLRPSLSRDIPMSIAPFHCCEKVFYSHANYIRHRCSKHGAQKLHICECECGKSFATNTDLRRHQRKENTQFTYDICSKVFKDKASLMGHTDTPNGMKRHTCGCGKAFRDPNTLMLDKFQCGKLTDHGQ